MDKESTLDELRRQISDIERKQPLAVATDKVASFDGPLSLPSSVLHEVRHGLQVDAAGAGAFALAGAASWTSERRPAVFHIALQKHDHAFGIPYGPGLRTVGLEVSKLVLVRVEQLEDMLWAAEEAAGCKAVAGVVLDMSGFRKPIDFTAGRRLSLRAAEQGCGVIVVRHGPEGGATAATFRWGISPRPSAPLPFDDRAPGDARWNVRLEKGSMPGLQTGNDIDLVLREGAVHALRLPASSVGRSDVHIEDRAAPCRKAAAR